MRDARDWTHAALFGALWGAAEATLGTALKVTQLPLSGLVMAAVGVLCLVTVRRLRPRIGICLVAGVVAAFLKVFTLGGVVVGPVVGIVSEAMVVELAMTATRSSLVGALVGGALALATTPLQRVISAGLIAGPDAVKALALASQAVAARIGLAKLSAGALLALVIVVTGGAGAAVGAWSWRVAGRVARRLRGSA
ncbi:MAG: hypothetical protein ACHQQS_05450 [Thermoanaerobaculales bacterium]